MGRARVAPALGRRLGAKRSRAGRHGEHLQRRMRSKAGATRRAGANCGTTRRCRLLVWHATPRRRRLGSLRALGRARVGSALGRRLGAKRSRAGRHGEHLQRRMRPKADPTRRAGANCGATRRCRLLVWHATRRRRRLDWRRNSPRRGYDPKPDRLLDWRHNSPRRGPDPKPDRLLEYRLRDPGCVRAGRVAIDVYVNWQCSAARFDGPGGEPDLRRCAAKGHRFEGATPGQPSLTAQFPSMRVGARPAGRADALSMRSGDKLEHRPDCGQDP